MKGKTVLLLELYLKMGENDTIKIYLDDGNFVLNKRNKLQLDGADIYYASDSSNNQHKINIFRAEDIKFIEVVYKGDNKLWSSISKPDL